MNLFKIDGISKGERCEMIKRNAKHTEIMAVWILSPSLGQRQRHHQGDRLQPPPAIFIIMHSFCNIFRGLKGPWYFLLKVIVVCGPPPREAGSEDIAVLLETNLLNFLHGFFYFQHVTPWLTLGKLHCRPQLTPSFCYKST